MPCRQLVAADARPVPVERMRAYLRIKPATDSELNGFTMGLGSITLAAATSTMDRDAVTMLTDTATLAHAVASLGGGGSAHAPARLPSIPQLRTGSEASTVASRTYALDHVFDEGAQQGDVYATTVAPLVGDLFHGKNFTVATYGMTGSGMLLFARARAASSLCTPQVTGCYARTPPSRSTKRTAYMCQQSRPQHVRSMRICPRRLTR
ncbi:hypothetical protein EON66_00925 [archaeon]|nr:MAG: hypothetical protein EON66_00925 [archaeon]